MRQLMRQIRINHSIPLLSMAYQKLARFARSLLNTVSASLFDIEQATPKEATLLGLPRVLTLPVL